MLIRLGLVGLGFLSIRLVQPTDGDDSVSTMCCIYNFLFYTIFHDCTPHQVTAGQMTVDQMAVGQLTIDEML